MTMLALPLAPLSSLACCSASSRDGILLLDCFPLLGDLLVVVPLVVVVGSSSSSETECHP